MRSASIRMRVAATTVLGLTLFLASPVSVFAEFKPAPDPASGRVADSVPFSGPELSGGPVVDPVADLLPGHWLEVPDSRMDVLDPGDDPALNPNWPIEAPWHGVEGLSGIMDDWSSAAYDTLRDRLAVWGGGHSGYAGNEIYVFDVATLEWLRITDPSVDVSITGTTLYTDGQPRARETYNYMEYLPQLDRMMVIGGGNLYPCCTVTQEVIAFDFDALIWDLTTYAPRPVGGAPYSSIATVDDATGHVWFIGNGLNRLLEFDPVANIWTSHAFFELLLYRNGAIDPLQRKFVWFGRFGDLVAYDLETPAIAPVQQPTSGDTEIQLIKFTGFVYHPVRKMFVAWGTGSDVYTLDASTWVWTRIAADPANTVVPTAPNLNGTNGRFRYIPSRDAFILVNGVDENVFFYRLPPGPGDVDADGQHDATDNCLFEPNGIGIPDVGGAVQLDSDGDGIGNRCDADIAIPNDCVVNFLDFAVVRDAFLATPGTPEWNATADFNNDGQVNFLDLFVIQSHFLQDYTLENPSGAANICSE